MRRKQNGMIPRLLWRYANAMHLIVIAIQFGTKNIHIRAKHWLIRNLHTVVTFLSGFVRFSHRMFTTNTSSIFLPCFVCSVHSFVDMYVLVTFVLLVQLLLFPYLLSFFSLLVCIFCAGSSLWCWSHRKKFSFSSE